MTISLIATEMGYPVYVKAGFREQTEYVFLSRNQAFQKYPASERISSLKDCDTEIIIELDQSVIGEDRRKVIMDNLKDARVYKCNRTIRGCYLPYLGEGIIIATDDEAGIELMKLRSSRREKAVIPIENTVGLSFILENGFEDKLHVKRMILGNGFAWHPSNVYNRIGGNFG